MWLYIAVFILLFIVDFAWTRYILCIKDGDAGRAAAWAGFLYFLQGMATIGVIRDNVALIPALLGAAAGTYVGVVAYRKPKKETVAITVSVSTEGKQHARDTQQDDANSDANIGTQF